MTTEIPATHDVFLSYSSKDKAWADAACAVLEKYNIRCWVAPRDITPGDEWGAAIIQGLASSRMMVLIFSGHANASGQVRREVERAISSGKAVLPLRIENITPHGALEYALGNTHWLDAFTPPIEKQLLLLAKSVATLLEIKTPAADDFDPNQSVHEPDAAPRLNSSSLRSGALRRYGAIAIGFAFVLAVGAFLVRNRVAPTSVTPVAVAPSNTNLPGTVTEPSTTTDAMDTPATGLETIDVLAKIAMNTSKKKRNWEFKGGVLYSSGSDPDWLRLPVSAPDEYRLELTVARPRPGGKSDFWIGVPCGENRCAVVLDGWSGTASGISNIDGKVAIYNETNYDGHIFQRAHPVNIVVTVRQRSIDVTVDEKTIVKWRGDPSRLSVDRPMPTGAKLLSIGTFGAFYRIDKLTLTPLAPLSGG